MSLLSKGYDGEILSHSKRIRVSPSFRKTASDTKPSPFHFQSTYAGFDAISSLSMYRNSFREDEYY